MNSIISKTINKIPNKTNHNIISLFSNVNGNDGTERSTVFRRSVEAKGAMKSFFNESTSNTNSNSNATTETGET